VQFVGGGARLHGVGAGQPHGLGLQGDGRPAPGRAGP
jgi:hypothetical protein